MTIRVYREQLVMAKCSSGISCGLLQVFAMLRTCFCLSPSPPPLFFCSQFDSLNNNINKIIRKVDEIICLHTEIELCSVANKKNRTRMKTLSRTESLEYEGMFA